jgi:hypothetical protein
MFFLLLGAALPEASHVSRNNKKEVMDKPLDNIWESSSEMVSCARDICSFVLDTVIAKNGSIGKIKSSKRFYTPGRILDLDAGAKVVSPPSDWIGPLSGEVVTPDEYSMGQGFFIGLESPSFSGIPVLVAYGRMRTNTKVCTKNELSQKYILTYVFG